LGSRVKRQLDSLHGESQNGNFFDGLCDAMKKFVQCEKSAIVRECGQETFDLMVQISQGTVAVFDDSCNVTDPNGKPAGSRPSGSGPCPPPKCVQRFAEASGRKNSSAISHPGKFPSITTEQYLQQCEIADALRNCFDETDAWTACANDASFKSTKNTLFAFCPVANRDVLTSGIDCLNDLNNRDPDFHRCMAQFNNQTNNAAICGASNEVYKCIRDPVVNHCGAKVYAMMVNITGSMLETMAPGCSFAPSMDSTPNSVSKKPPPAVGELRGEMTEKPNESSAKIPIASFFLLAFATILAFW